MKALVRGSLSGTISKNINTLMEKLSVAGSIKQQALKCNHISC